LTIPASAFQPHIPMNEGAVDGGEDVMIQRAIAIIQVEERASISLLQRKLGIGYMRAARLIEKLEEMGIIGKPEPNSGVRPVLIFGNSETKE
jgi:S-DNA-T family DNA segregation ATPase FtsK/SpoIIIE